MEWVQAWGLSPCEDSVVLFSISIYVAWSQALAFLGFSLSICEVEIEPTTDGT